MIEVLQNRQPGQVGFFSDIDIEDYHAGEGVSSSKLGPLIDCPAKFNNIRKPKSHLELGQAFHVYFLERHIFDETYGILHEPNGVTKAAKAEKAELQQAGYANFIKVDKLKALEKMKQCIMSDPMSQFLFNPNDEHYVEHSGYWIEPETGVLCRFRPDYLVVKGDHIFSVDLKTTLDCSPEEIARTIGKWKYHRQSAFYLDGIKARTGFKNVIPINFFIEKPMQDSVIWTDEQMAVNSLQCLPARVEDEDIDQGRRDYKRGLNNYKRFILNGQHPGYRQLIEMESTEEKLDWIDISLPRFRQDPENKMQRSI